ncbi:MAG: hypothetical protein EPO08_11675 [Rhodospirillaceae bacterium]|nr:MAG: hypothetical protein EPO08_11675 [Rhodospirillaceae bacterium]
MPHGPIIDSDMDSLFVLPLSIIPLTTESLRSSRLIKNHHMMSVIEVFGERATGSGQISVDHLPNHFQWKEGYGHKDMGILSKVAPLPSYDVYTLRRSLRELGVPVNNHADLKLTDDKNRQLTGYMTRFTLPLIREVYGETARDVQRFEDLVQLFKDPDVKKALARLKQMAEKLQIGIEQIPRFIEDYGDIFLALAYYNHCLDRLAPLIENFVQAMADLRKSMQVRNDRNLMAEIDRQEKMLTGLVNFLKRMFQEFGVMSRDLWSDLTASKFNQVRAYIESTQVKVGSVLCGLTVKMNAWATHFPNPRAGGPGAKCEFIMTEMRPGMTELIGLARGA